MTYTLMIMDRGRPIATHPELDREAGTELAQAYIAIGWPETKIVLQADEPSYAEKVAA